MDSNPTQLILRDCGIAYTITDCDLIALEVKGATDILNNTRHKYRTGMSLLDMVPELIGNEAILANILAGKLSRFQLVYVNRETVTGQTLYLTMITLPHRNRKGQVNGLVHLVKDITELARLIQQLTQQRNELRLLETRVVPRNHKTVVTNSGSVLLTALNSSPLLTAHELRSPLTTIMGFVEVLLEGDYEPLTDQQHEVLTIVQRNAHRLFTVIDSLINEQRQE